VSDVVSPNAIRRCINRTLSQYGVSGWLREVGTADLPGLYLDGDATSTDAAEAFWFDDEGEGAPGTLLSVAGAYPTGFSGVEHVTFAVDGVTYTANFASTDQTQAQVVRRMNLAAGFNAWTALPGNLIALIGRKTSSEGFVQIVGTSIDILGVLGIQAGAPMYGSDTPALPQDRYKYLLDYTDFRAFFVVGVPPLALGEFGASFDSGSSSAFDAAPFACFFDGYPLTAACAYRTLWGAINNARAGGVGFQLELDSYGSL
jgi:hypothetical protein